MKKTIIFLALLMTINNVKAQIPIGIKYDLNARPLNGYYDPMVYSPGKNILEVHNSFSYEIGYYYDEQGNKVTGQIKFDNSKIWFRKINSEFGEKYKPDDIHSFVIGIDSFLVVSNFFIGNTLNEKNEYVQYITEFNDRTIVKHYNLKRGIGDEITSMTSTYLIKHKDSLKWDGFSENNYRKNALIYFGEVPFLKAKIVSNKFEKVDILSLIKEAEYYYKFQNQDAIYYNRYWQEISGLGNVEYFAKIIDKKDSIWTFEYYKDSTKLYQVNYSSFYPNIKEGDFTAYYPNGKIRQIVSFEDNKQKEIKTFNKEGLIEVHYDIIENKNSHTLKIVEDIKYKVVNDSMGNNILKSTNKSTITNKDALSGFGYTSTYKNEKLFSVYRILNNDTVFIITDPYYDFNIKSLQSKFDFFMSKVKYDNALNENAQGTLLVSFLLDKKGYVVESTMLNEIHPEIDRLIEKFINNTFYTGNGSSYNFKPYKKDKVKRYCEVVIPFKFSINKFYRRPVDYYFFDHHMHWQMQQQMMNQQMMNNIRPPSF